MHVLGIHFQVHMLEEQAFLHTESYTKPQICLSILSFELTKLVILW